jgi:hypothetical protein
VVPLQAVEHVPATKQLPPEAETAPERAEEADRAAVLVAETAGSARVAMSQHDNAAAVSLWGAPSLHGGLLQLQMHQQMCRHAGCHVSTSYTPPCPSGNLLLPGSQG